MFYKGNNEAYPGIGKIKYEGRDSKKSSGIQMV